jgi:hypothetical protein
VKPEILMQLRFIQNWVITGIQWMVHWQVLVHSGPKQATYNMHDKDFVITKK